MRTIKFSPSSLTFLYDECKRCFYLSMHEQLKRPTTPFPKIFSRIDGAMKEYFTEHPIHELDDDLPRGRIAYTQKWVESVPMEFPNHELSPFFRGLFDAVVDFDEGGYGLIDFKTSEYVPDQLPFYQRQLSSYVFALENPAPGKLHLAPVKQMGLVYYTPDSFLPLDKEHVSLKGHVHWKEIERDDDGFRRFIDQVLTVLELPEPPEADPECGFCKYRQQARELNL